MMQVLQTSIPRITGSSSGNGSMYVPLKVCLLATCQTFHVSYLTRSKNDSFFQTQVWLAEFCCPESYMPSIYIVL